MWNPKSKKNKTISSTKKLKIGLSLIEIFETKIQDTPKTTCSICQPLCFMKDIRPMKQKGKKNYYTLMQIKYETPNNFIC